MTDLPVTSLVERLVALDWHTLGADTRAATRSLLIDALGVSAAASAAPSLKESAEALARMNGPVGPAGGIHVPWWGEFGGVADAALAHSLAIHAWDFDDTHDDAVVHTACIAVAAALAVGQQCGATGQRVLEAVVCGVEMLSRLSLMVGPQAGVIRTAGLGSLGAAAATAKVLGLGVTGMEAALALALPAALAPTSRQVVSDSAVNKRHQPGMAVRDGVTAGYLAAAGIRGPAGWFHGEHGIRRAIASPEVAAEFLRRPGWEIDRVSLKPFPACRYGHAALAGVLELTGGSPRPEARVRVHLPVGAAHAMVARPFERRGLPIVDAQFSVPWLVAAALTRGAVGLPEMAEDVLTDPSVEHVARRQIEVVQDQDAGSRVMTPVQVELTDPSGTRSITLTELPGSPARRLSRTEQVAKLRGCLAVVSRPPGDADRLVSFIDDLERVPASDLGTALRVVSPPHPARISERELIS